MKLLIVEHLWGVEGEEAREGKNLISHVERFPPFDVRQRYVACKGPTPASLPAEKSSERGMEGELQRSGWERGALWRPPLPRWF